MLRPPPTKIEMRPEDLVFFDEQRRKKPLEEIKIVKKKGVDMEMDTDEFARKMPVRK